MQLPKMPNKITALSAPQLSYLFHLTCILINRFYHNTFWENIVFFYIYIAQQILMMHHTSQHSSRFNHTTCFPLSRNIRLSFVARTEMTQCFADVACIDCPRLSVRSLYKANRKCCQALDLWPLSFPIMAYPNQTTFMDLIWPIYH